MAELPSGTVTFLAAAVEDGAALPEEAPEAVGAALARLDVIIEAAVGAHGGARIDRRDGGDSRCAVFRSAHDAADAAIAMQRALVAQPWPTPRPVRVRLGLHTGEAEPHGGQYRGSDLD